MAGQGDQDVNSDSDSDSFQRDPLPTHPKRMVCASRGRRALAFPPTRLKEQMAVEEGKPLGPPTVVELSGQLTSQHPSGPQTASWPSQSGASWTVVSRPSPVTAAWDAWSRQLP